MKKRSYIRLPAILLAAVVLLTAAACGDSGVPDITDSPATEQTTAEPGTAAFREFTDAAYVPEADEPYNMRILISPVSYDTVLASENAPETDPLGLRAQRLKSEFSIVTESVSSGNITEAVTSGSLSGLVDYDFMIVTAGTDGAYLMTGGYLQNISLTGMDITPDSEGVNAALTGSLTFESRVYLLFCDALTSDIGATSALLAKSDISCLSELSAAVTSGSFTCEYFLALMKSMQGDTDSYGLFDIGDSGCMLSVLDALGGSVFTKNGSDMPAASLESESFEKAYSAASSLYSASSDGAETFRVSYISSAAEGDIILPLPSLSSEYRSRVNLSACSAIAVPDGIIYGRRTAGLVRAFIAVSDGLRKSAVSDAVKSGTEGASQLLAAVIGSQCADGAAFFGWGDLDDIALSCLTSGKSYSELISDRSFSSRIKAVDAAAAIIASRLS